MSYGTTGQRININNKSTTGEYLDGQKWEAISKLGKERRIYTSPINGFCVKYNLPHEALGNLSDLSYLSRKINTPGAWIAGGAVMRAITNEIDKGDIDVFCADLVSCEIVINDFVEAGWVIAEEDKKLLESNPAAIKYIQLKPPDNHNIWQKPIQVVKMKWFDSLPAVLKSFDLSVSMLAIANDNIYYNPDAVEDVLNKRIVVTNSIFPVSTLKRIKKLEARGFKTVEDVSVTEFLGEITNSTKEGNKCTFEVEKELKDRIATGTLWDNPEYRKDYYELEPNQFKAKWEAHG